MLVTFHRPLFHTAPQVPYGAYIPTLDTPFIGNAPGVWEDTRPPNASCWRLSNDDYTKGATVGAAEPTWLWWVDILGVVVRFVHKHLVITYVFGGGAMDMATVISEVVRGILKPQSPPAVKLVTG